MNRIRLRNGKTVVVPEGIDKAAAALLLHRNGAINNEPVVLNGENLRFVIRCGIPKFVPATLTSSIL